MVTIASAARMTMATTAVLSSGSGSLNGTAAQVGLPSMSPPCLLHRAGARLFGSRDCLIDDALKQVGLDRAIGCRRHGFARLCQCSVAGIVERRPGAAYLFDPGVEI